jgi:lysophospholipase L1-like esterase
MIVFLGDSITQWWDAEYFNHYFGMYKPVNLGIAGHTSKDTLEYMELSHFNNLKPSNVVLQIGTNDGDHEMTTGETASNIEKICNLVFEHSPNSSILLVGPLPRGERFEDRHNIYNREVNKLLRASTFRRGKQIKYIDIGIMFRDDKGQISKDIMYDYLHLTKKGYHILSEVVCEFLFSSSSEPASPVPCPRLS